MQTKKVKALDMLEHPLPMIVKGVRGVYEVIKVVSENYRVTCYTAGKQGGLVATLRKPDDGVFEVILTEHNADHLLDTVGMLHKRNKSLTKGHATLTRRVQELEAQLAEAQQQILANSSGDFAVVGGKTYIKETVIEDAVISKAHHDLQQFVTEEVKRQMVATIKLGGLINGR